MAVHVYIPFGGINDDTKKGILDRLNQPNDAFGFVEPQIIMGPPLEGENISKDASIPPYPDHSQAKLSEVVEKELAHGRSTGRNAALFVWAEGSALQPRDATVRVIYAESSSSESAQVDIEEIRAEVGQVAGILNCVESGNQSFGECQDWVGPDGVVRGDKEVPGEAEADTQSNVPQEEVTRKTLKTKKL